MKILHMADCHLDTPFRGLPPRTAALRRQALRDGFRRALERGAREGVDAVLIAGDLFDNPYRAPSTVQLLIMWFIVFKWARDAMMVLSLIHI